MQNNTAFYQSFISRALCRRVPYFGHRDTYFLGSGTVGASGSADGVWSFAIGPDYTSPNLLQREQFFLVQRQQKNAVPLEMYRLRGSGCFFGMGRAETLVCTLTDAVLPENGDTADREKLLRVMTVENTGDAPADFAVRLELDTACRVSTGANAALLVAPAGSWCFGNQESHTPKPHALQLVLPPLAVGSAPEALSAQGSTLTFTLPLCLNPGEIAVLPVWHLFGENPEAACPVLPQPEAFLTRALQDWQRWLEEGDYPGVIADRRLHDAVEALLLCVKMEQNRDGGMIAGIRKYANSYIRDTHGGMRLLHITGHTREVAALLRNIHSRWEKAGFIPNWWSMGSDTFIGNSFHNDAAEVTAYYLFMARDHLEACARQGARQAAAARALVEQLLPSLQWAAQAQQAYLTDHGYLMDFNGDETEQYACTADGQEYGLFGHYGAKDEMGFTMAAASFASTAAAVQSLRWFAAFTGQPCYAQTAERAAQALETAFWQPEQGSHSWLADAHGPRDTRVTNFLLLPFWLGVRLAQGREEQDALAALALQNKETGFWPDCPGRVEGFCGHTPGLALYAALQLAPEKAPELVQQILNGHLLGCFGTVSEFYGPGGVANGHNARPFEGGIVGEALVRYAMRQTGKEM